MYANAITAAMTAALRSGGIMFFNSLLFMAPIIWAVQHIHVDIKDCSQHFTVRTLLTWTFMHSDHLRHKSVNRSILSVMAETVWACLFTINKTIYDTAKIFATVDAMYTVPTVDNLLDIIHAVDRRYVLILADADWTACACRT